MGFAFDFDRDNIDDGSHILNGSGRGGGADYGNLGGGGAAPAASSFTAATAGGSNGQLHQFEFGGGPSGYNPPLAAAAPTTRQLPPQLPQYPSGYSSLPRGGRGFGGPSNSTSAVTANSLGGYHNAPPYGSNGDLGRPSSALSRSYHDPDPYLNMDGGDPYQVWSLTHF